MKSLELINDVDMLNDFFLSEKDNLICERKFANVRRDWKLIGNYFLRFIYGEIYKENMRFFQFLI